MNTEHPLILVFYLDRSLMQQPNIITPFVASVDTMIKSRGANIMSFFIPTDKEERVECINPVQLAEPELTEVKQIIEDIKKNFDLNPKIETPIEEITIEGKSCECGNNPDGDCLCKN